MTLFVLPSIKRISISLLLFFSTPTIFAQGNIPSYPEVLRSFFSRYAVYSETEDFLNFAKKKDGWFIQKINRLKNDTVLNEILFWSKNSNAYLNLNEEFKSQENQDEAEINVNEYLNGNSTAYRWYDYERCRYHGYNGWAEDLIDDFGNQDNLTDTLLESLARAYSSVSNTYLWYQQGGKRYGDDTLQIILTRLQMPSPERIHRVIDLITKSIESLNKLQKQNPSYITTIGNVHLKRFNEYMHGYMQMSISMNDTFAKSFIDKAELGEEYIKQAKNYLNSCDQNGILFTYGDNDTYQLWYVQEKENFRRDVTVINTSMLGLPSYIDMLRKKEMVNFSAIPSFYETPGSDITYFKEGLESSDNIHLNLNDYLNNIYSRKESTETIDYLTGQPQINSTYSIKKINLSINNDSFNLISDIKATTNNISFVLKDYLFISDILVFDIINQNINNRPIYFTAQNQGYLDSNLVQQGIVFRIVPTDNSAKAIILKKEVELLEIFADSVYLPIVSFPLNGVTHISPDGNNVFFQLFSRIADYYTSINDLEGSSNWLDKASNYVPEISLENMPAGYMMASSNQNYNQEVFKHILEKYANYLYNKYYCPTATTGYMTKGECLQYLNSLNKYFEEENIKSPTLHILLKKIKEH